VGAGMSIDAVINVVINDIKERWIEFISSVDFDSSVPLAFKVDAMSLTVEPYIAHEYPFLGSDSALFWSLYRTAVVKSKTHGYGEVMHAFDEVIKIKFPVTRYNKLILPLNTKIKRISAVVALIGFAMFLIGSLQIIDHEWHYSGYLETLIYSLSLSGYEYERYWLAACGFYALTIGVMFSYAYDKTVGRLILWVMSAPN
jgi:hypothetical protein